MVLMNYFFKLNPKILYFMKFIEKEVITPDLVITPFSFPHKVMMVNVDMN